MRLGLFLKRVFEMPDPYASCPCGSGKKFKWCCQPIYAGINQAMQQEEHGQHEAALRTLGEVVRQHAGNPEAWGRQAQLLYANGKTEEAENALQKAFDLQPNYPFGLASPIVAHIDEQVFDRPADWLLE